MYRIDRNANSIGPLRSTTFSEMGFYERPHLQEWIAKAPQCLGESLLIIQKEFAGFSDTSERLDLLALDKQGRLVLIENKLDDTGKDVVWQALKYASYCSSLDRNDIIGIYQDHLNKTSEIVNASDALCKFFDISDINDLILNTGTSQRIILIAGSFRKEVTSTAIWLLKYKIQIQCIKSTIFTDDTNCYVHFDQIIPVKDAEDFMIKLAEKEQLESSENPASLKRNEIYRKFWSKLLTTMNSKSDLFKNISAGPYHYMGVTSGTSGIRLNFVASGKICRAELYIDLGNKQHNEQIFDKAKASSLALEAAFGGELIWERLDDARACRIKAEKDANIYNEDSWPEMIEYMTDAMIRMDRAFRGTLGNP